MKKLKIIIFFFLLYLTAVPYQHTHFNIYDLKLLTIPPLCQFSAIIDGNEFSLEENQKGIKAGSNSFKNIKKQPDSSRVIFQSYFFKSSGGDVIIELNYGTLKYQGMKPSVHDFENFFKNGKINYSVLAYDGIEIKYRDSKGKLWNTSNGFQQGSNFEFTEFQKDSNSVKFKAVFSCMVYNSSHESKTIENGVFIGHFLNN